MRQVYSQEYAGKITNSKRSDSRNIYAALLMVEDLLEGAECGNFGVKRTSK